MAKPKDDAQQQEQAQPTQDPFEGKSIDELKEIIKGLENEKAETTKKLNSYVVLVQSTIISLKETGLDLQVIGRNMDRILGETTNPRRPPSSIQPS